MCLVSLEDGDKNLKSLCHGVRGGQKKAIAREEGRKIEKRRRRRGRGREVEKEEEKSSWMEWRGGIKGTRGGRKLDSMGKNITWLVLQAPPRRSLSARLSRATRVS